jgi:TPR repeat protein
MQGVEKSMSNKHDIQRLPTQGNLSISPSEPRSSLIARGRNDASSILARKPEPKLPAEGGPANKSDLASHGDGSMEYTHGYSYYRGLGVPQDYSAAADWFRKAADLGHAGAQNSFGYSYYYGEGVSRDYVEAVTWFRRAAEQGHAGAQINLGHAYYHGEGVSTDYTQAALWYTTVRLAQSLAALRYRSHTVRQDGLVLRYFPAQQLCETNLLPSRSHAGSRGK